MPYVDLDDVYTALGDIPTTDARYVELTRWIDPVQKGVWIYDEEKYQSCVACKNVVYEPKQQKFNFCPYCGRKVFEEVKQDV